MDNPAPRPSNGVDLSRKVASMRTSAKILLAAEQEHKMEQELKLKRDISDHGSHIYIDPSHPNNPFPSFEKWKREQGVKAYKQFSEQCAVVKDLEAFRTKCRRLGVPLGLISSAKNIEKQIQVLQYFIWRNAITLHGEQVKEAHNPDPPPKIPDCFEVKTKDGIDTRTAYAPNDFSDVMDRLAHELSIFLDYWINLPKFVEERVSKAATQLFAELEYRVKCFRRDYEGCKHFDHSTDYRHDLCAILGYQISEFCQALNDFVEIGSSAVQASQEYRRLNLRNMSVIATFFSAVASAMAQLAIPMHDTTLEKAVGLLFIASLIFSIGAVIQSLWALSWDHASHRAPDEQVPAPIVFWATHSPLVLMATSISSFSAGLVALCYAVLDGTVFWVVFSITLFCASGFFITAMWSWAEWLVYQRHKGTKWLANILSTYFEQMWDSPLVEKIRHLGQRLYQNLTDAFKAAAGISSWLVTASRNRSRSSHPEKQSSVLPTFTGGGRSGGVSGLVNKTKKTIKSAIRDPSSDSGASDPAFEMKLSDLVVITDEEARAPWFWSRGPNEQPVCLMLKIPKAHEDMIKHMQFNPGANHHDTLEFILATQSTGAVRLWGPQKDSDTIQRIYGSADLHTTPLGSGYKRYAWAPDGSRLLTRADKETKVWSSAGGLETPFPEKRPAGCTVWSSDGKSILSSHRSSVRSLDARGTEKNSWELKRVSWIHDMVDTAQGERIVVVGETESRADRHSIAECAIVVYNTGTKKYESVTPICNRARTLERVKPQNSPIEYYLLSFEEAPPQLWQLDMAEDMPRLTLSRTYAASSESTTFTGPACFGRIKDVDLVLIPTASVVYMLEMLTGNLVYALRVALIPNNGISPFTSVAWDHLSPHPRFATGSVDGTVAIWTSEPEHQPGAVAVRDKADQPLSLDTTIDR